MHRVLISLPFLLATTGCTTITEGSHEYIILESEPPGAMVTTDIAVKKPITLDNGETSNVLACAPTPCRINMYRRDDATVTVSKPGYQSIKFNIVSTWEPGVSSVPAGSIVAGLPPGSHVIAGKGDFLKNTAPINIGTLFVGTMTFGSSLAIDAASGANLSLSPNPVSIFLASDEPLPEDQGTE